MDLTYLRTFACQAQGCADYADYGRHAPNCVQAEFDTALDEVDRLQAALHHFARPTHGGNWRCPVCGQVVTAGFAHRADCEVGMALTP